MIREEYRTGFRYVTDRDQAPDFIRTNCLITSVTVEPAGTHDDVTIWNRGAMCGILKVTRGDGERIATRLLTF